MHHGGGEELAHIAQPARNLRGRGAQRTLAAATVVARAVEGGQGGVQPLVARVQRPVAVLDAQDQAPATARVPGDPRDRLIRRRGVLAHALVPPGRGREDPTHGRVSKTMARCRACEAGRRRTSDSRPRLDVGVWRQVARAALSPRAALVDRSSPPARLRDDWPGSGFRPGPGRGPGRSTGPGRLPRCGDCARSRRVRTGR